MNFEETLVRVLGTVVIPLKAGEIARQARLLLGGQATPKAVAATLDRLVERDVVKSFNAGTAAKPLRYYTLSDLVCATAALLRPHVHSAKKAPETAKLKARLPASLHVCFEDALALLVDAGEAFVLPGAKRLVYAHKPGPSAFLSAAQRKALQKILDQANSLRSSPATLEDFISWLDEGAAAPPVVRQPHPPSPAPPPLLDESLLREWYAQDRVRSSTVMIPIPQTFARYEAWAHAHGAAADSQVLRNFMEGLYNNGLVLLEPCERPQDLPAHERAMLVPMSLGPPGWSWCWVD